MEKEKAGVTDTDVKKQKNGTEDMDPVENNDQKNGNSLKIKVKTEAEKAGGNLDTEGEEAVEDVEAKLEAVEKEKAEINDRLLRAAAEFDNYKKRQDKQWCDFKKYANEALAKDLLTVVDNLERAIAAAREAGQEDSGLAEGVKMTLGEVLKILERYGVTPIKSAGEKFDPNFHQAVSTQPVEDMESNIVLEEYQKGYLIHDRLLRPAMVVVSAAAKPARDTE